MILFHFFKPAICILLQWWMLILHIARFSHFWCQHVDEYSLWAKRSGFRLLCLRPFFFILGCLWCQRQRLFLYTVIWGKRLRPSVREEQPIRTKWRNSALFLSDELSGCTKSQYQIIRFILTCESCKASKKKYWARNMSNRWPLKRVWPEHLFNCFSFEPKTLKSEDL